MKRTANEETPAERKAQHRAAYAALANKVYFNFGGQGPMATEAIEAILASYKYVQEQGPFSGASMSWFHRETETTRRSLAELLGALESEIALTANVTDGCNIVMWGVEWKAGDHLLLSDGEHAGVVASAQQIAARRSVELTYCPLTESLPGECAEIIRSHIRKGRTKLVMLSHVLWNTGMKLPLEQIAAVCHEHDALLLVDGAQSAGVLPVNVKDLAVDFYALTGHKWLCGPDGLGALYIARARLPQILPTFVGWRSIIWSDEGQPAGWLDNAQRYEVATAPFPLLSGLRQALEVHARWGTAEQRHAEVIRLAGKLKQGLSALAGVRCRPAEQESGLVSFCVDNCSHAQIVKELETQGKIVVRSIPFPDCIRASVHYFNTDEDIDLLITAISDLSSI